MAPTPRSPFAHRNTWLTPFVAMLSLLVALAGCSDDVQQGITVPADGWGVGDGSPFGDSKNNLEAGEWQDSASTDGSDSSAPGSDSQVVTTGGELFFAHNKDDFGGVCETMCSLLMYQNSSRKIGVRYVVDGVPTPAALVEFALVDPSNKVGAIKTAGVFTDDNGEAWTDVTSGTELGSFEVVARVIDDPSIADLPFKLLVQSKVKGPLTITPHYAGAKLQSQFGAIQLRLTRQVAGQPACKGLDMTSTLPTAEWKSPNLKFDKPWTLSFPTFPNWVKQNQDANGEVAFTVVGVAYKYNANPANATPISAGCIDTGAVVKLNAQGVPEGDPVIVNIYDLPPRLAGVYDITSNIDLLSILPDPVELVLKTVIDVMTDPVAGVLALVCKLSNSSLQSLCGAVFDDPKDPNINELKGFGGIIVKFLSQIIKSFLPAEVQSAFNTGADIGQILTNLEISGTLEIKKEPDPATQTLTANDTKQVWTTITYKWSAGAGCNPQDPNCGKKSFNIEQFQAEAIVGQFTLWRNIVLSEIDIGKHALSVKWGALVNYLVQKQVLPILTYDPNYPSVYIDTYQELFKSILAGKACLQQDTCCNEFATQLAPNSGGLFNASTLAGMCEVLVELGSTMLDTTLNNLGGQSGNATNNTGLLLSAQKCAAIDVNDDMYIDALGGMLGKDMCLWNMTLTIGGTPQPIDSKFFAKRSN